MYIYKKLPARKLEIIRQIDDAIEANKKEQFILIPKIQTESDFLSVNFCCNWDYLIIIWNISFL